MNEGGDLPDEAIRLADVLSQVDPDRAANYQGDLPFALINAGRREQALAHIQANLARFPDDVWIRAHAGDVYTELGEDAGALEFYISALKAAIDPCDWDAFRDRALEVLQRLGRTQDWAGIQQEAPRPSTQAVAPWTVRTPAPPLLMPALLEPLTSPVSFHGSPKIGVNDPCPCGSGRKYKKCCKR
jgi:tetratricopeptide (TPR) repeat protein